ncbi:cob(I)yrinic acid a,c-diamide adenosyltransferase [Patescibacteria group bacterium]|nr:cob(I)yrinic acid a,c-diamide adenosyltransferase [Patescibacteria group bacterium]MBU1473071.1 cob(I)yrinic acid a,c-diamide adenosyltransferase [Patescibacteria group bacterium]MBU2460173.1 cob(I)yrinic acid a,c-diamide adenosyltransferase [Patescibacteria group bacterium]MBU2544489.1 cob(I)yrinic acid a,c-diamide adenosyltransferase [Patescibacteria group bacterium]
MNIYTRAGDKGFTSIFGGKRVLKCHELVDTYGFIDELNSWVGLIISQLNKNDETRFFVEVQKQLLAIGSSLAGWKGLKKELVEKQIKKMEIKIDLMEKTLPTIKNFVLPGGSRVGSIVHIARSICRRAERQTVSLAQKQIIQPEIIKYLNRLSDLLFVFARFINSQGGVTEVVWSGDASTEKKR